MKVTEIKIRKTFKEGSICALVSITLDDSIAIHDIRIIKSPERMFIAMPHRKGDDNMYRDIVHPIDVSTRAEIEGAVLQAYNDLKHV